MFSNRTWSRFLLLGGLGLSFSSFAIHRHPLSRTAGLPDQVRSTRTVGAGVELRTPPHRIGAPNVVSCTRSIDATARLVISGDDTAAQQLYQVSGAALLPSGRIALSSSGTQSVLLFDSAGSRIASFGRRGEGPLEFRTLAGLWRASDSSVLVADPGRSQVTVLSNELEYIRREQLDVGSYSRWPAVIGVTDASIIAINGQVFERGQMGVGVVRPPFEFLQFSATGRLIETILRLPGAEFFVPTRHGAQTTQAVPFGRNLLYAVGVGTLATLDTDDAMLRLQSIASSSASVVAVPLSQAKVTSAKIAEFKKQRRDEARSATQRRVAQELDQVPFPKLFPIADRMLIGQDGSVWIREYPSSTGDVAHWLTLTPDRKRFCSVALPRGFRLLDASTAKLLGVISDADDLESVVLYRLGRIEGNN